MQKLTEEQFNILAGIKASKNVNMGYRADGSVYNKNEYYRNEVFAKSLVSELYENIVYKEDFEISPEESMANLFAESILSYKTVENIAKAYNNRIPASMNNDDLKKYAKDQADQLTEMWAQETKFQMIEIENFKEGCEERGITPSSNFLCENFGLYNEFNNLMNVEKSDDGDFAKAVISEMSNDDKMKLAFRIDTFKNALNSIGVDTSDKDISTKIHEAFEKNLFI